MIKHPTTAIALGIVSVILFDALQQKFYLDTFNLYPDDPISFWQLFLNHLLRWSVWGIFSFIYGYSAWKLFKKQRHDIQFESWLMLGAFVLIVNLVAITSISGLNVLWYADTFNLELFSENILFILFQKGMSFSFASGLVLLLLYNYSGKLLINAQLVEIDELKSTSNQEIPTFTIKTGRKVKVIQLAEVQWIEAFDYCVKVHSSEKAYTMRCSMKSLEESLRSYNFVRVHRSALINLDYIDHIDFDSNLIKLLGKQEISFSKTGAKQLRSMLASKSI